MSNDIFIREVNEELRQERVRALWVRYGTAAVIVAVTIVLGVGGYVLWQRHQAGLEAANGDRLLAATALVEENRPDEARPILQDLQDNGVASYPLLARMRLAQIDLASDPARAISEFDAVAADTRAPKELRDMASVRAAYALVDHGTVADVRGRVEGLTTDGEPMRYAAREAIALAAWKAGDAETARRFFSELAEDFGTPAGIKRRADLMSEVIDASVGPAPAAAAATAPAAAPDASETSEAEASPAEAPPAEAPAAEAAGTATPPTPEAAAPAASDATPAPPQASPPTPDATPASPGGAPAQPPA